MLVKQVGPALVATQRLFCPRDLSGNNRFKAVVGWARWCSSDGNLYPKGIKVTDDEMQAINIMRDEFHGEWNYTISPNQQPP